MRKKRKKWLLMSEKVRLQVLGLAMVIFIASLGFAIGYLVGKLI